MFWRARTCCGSGMLISDPNFSIPDPGSKVKKIPDPAPHQRIFNHKICFWALGKIIWDVHLRYVFSPFRIRIPDLGVKQAPDPGSGSATVEELSILNKCHFFIQILTLATRMYLYGEDAGERKLDEKQWKKQEKKSIGTGDLRIRMRYMDIQIKPFNE